MSASPVILMVEPDYFDVSYRINPWMQPERWARDPTTFRLAARRAFDELCVALRGVGCELMLMPGLSELPDMVFPANAAIVLDRKALMARFRYPQRQGEEAPLLEHFQDLQRDGLLDAVDTLPSGCFQEGAGDCIWDATRQCFWAAHGPRSSKASMGLIEDHFGQEVVALELATARSYHLDVCFSPLAGGEILYYPPALTLASREQVRRRVPAELLIEATEEDLAHFSVNAVNVDDQLVLARSTEALRERLSRRGYRLHEVDLQPFLLAGGGAFCMTLRLDRRSVRSHAAGDSAARSATQETRRCKLDM